MNTRFLGYFLSIALLLTVAPASTMDYMGMEGIQEAADPNVKVVLIIIQGPWQDGSQLCEGGAFYTNITTQVAAHNSEHSDKQILIEPFTCPRGWNDQFDSGKVNQARALATRVLKQRKDDRIVHIFANAGGPNNFGGGADVLAIASQILNTQAREDLKPATRASRYGSITTAEENFFTAIGEAQQNLSPEKQDQDRAVTRGFTDMSVFQLDNAHRKITAHYVGTLPRTSYMSSVNFDDETDIVDAVHHHGSCELTFSEKFKACCICCCQTTADILKDEKFQAAAGLVLKILITLAITAI